MNVERIKQLAEHLRKPETAEHFDMTNFISSNAGTVGRAMKGCGTTACVAGWAVALFAPRTAANIASSDADDIACELLGLDYAQGEALFFPPGFTSGALTPNQAADALDRLAVTGEVHWSVAGGPTRTPQVSPPIREGQ